MARAHNNFPLGAPSRNIQIIIKGLTPSQPPSRLRPSDARHRHYAICLPIIAISLTTHSCLRMLENCLEHVSEKNQAAHKSIYCAHYISLKQTIICSSNGIPHKALCAALNKRTDSTTAKVVADPAIVPSTLRAKNGAIRSHPYHAHDRS